MKHLLAGTVAILLVAGLTTPAQAAPSEEEKIEAVLSAVIDLYQKGDYTEMGRYYAPEVTVVPSDYRPALVGWAQVAPRYQQAHANLTVVEMTRENTKIMRQGKVAWAVYQWRFTGMANQAPVAAEGHTTLVLEKRGREWLIVHNHTSAIPAAPPAKETPAAEPSS